ncbi:MAG: hypothetical protein JRN45_10605 [Nitrososphaerota archaeon]|nr:hypothetical protein [Nitrososphaerota archaeon]
MTLDKDHIRVLDQALLDARARRDAIATETKEKNRDSYYRIFGVFQPFTRVYIKLASSMRNPELRSLLVWGMKVYWIEAYDVHELATRGLYFATRRELRYMLEFSKRAAELDQSMKGAGLSDKLSAYQRREAEPDFRGGQLLGTLKANLSLTEAETNAIDAIFKELSSDVHGSFDEVRKVSPEQSLIPIYRQERMRESVKLASQVCDVHLLLMVRSGMLDSQSFAFYPNESASFPLTIEALRTQGKASGI